MASSDGTEKDKKEFILTVLGDKGVGKESLITRFITGNLERSYDPTAYDQYDKLVELDDDIGSCIIRINEPGPIVENPSLKDHFMRTYQVFILVYSLDSYQSFIALNNHFTTLMRIREDDLHSLNVILVGNKCDLMDERSVKREQGLAKAKEWSEKGIRTRFFETSAKESINCEEVFFEGVRMQNDQYSDGHHSSVIDASSSSDGGCCLIL